MRHPTDDGADHPARQAAPAARLAQGLLRLAPGVALAGGIAALAVLAARSDWAASLGLSALTLAILAGIVAGNTVFPRLAGRAAQGVDFARGSLLRAGIVLYGLRLTFQQVVAVGWSGVAIAALVVALTFSLAVLLGTRVLRLDRQTAMLIGAGSAICGAAAVLAAEPVVRAHAHKVSVAVATVVVFGTLSMFAYPLLYPHLGLSAQAYGVYAGSTIHEVAQVVVAVRSVNETAAAAGVTEKMLRVLLLAPFLMVLARALPQREAAGPGVAWRSVPWFAVLFIAASALQSLAPLPARVLGALLDLDTALLATAMAALGLRTRIGAVREAGPRPLLLALALFGFLVVGGYALNIGVTRALG